MRADPTRLLNDAFLSPFLSLTAAQQTPRPSLADRFDAERHAVRGATGGSCCSAHTRPDFTPLTCGSRRRAATHAPRAVGVDLRDDRDVAVLWIEAHPK